MAKDSMIDDELDDSFLEWFSPRVDRKVMKGLMARTNYHGLLFFGAWLLLCIGSGALVALSLGTYWLIPAMFLYGSILCFSYAASHECAHGTAFRTRWLNETVFWITSLIFIEEPIYRRYAHAEHHTHTWFNQTDPQKPYGIPLRLAAYLNETFGITFYFDAANRLVRHSRGRFSDHETQFLGPVERGQVRRNSRLMLAGYSGLLIWGIAGPSLLPFVFYFIPRLLGGWLVTMHVNTQHMGMAEDFKDHRLTTRSIECGLLQQLLYWNMNFHIEHHLFPSVPFHALPKLNAVIKSELPKPGYGVLSTNVQILRAIFRQRKEPDFNLSRPAEIDAISAGK